MKKILCLTTTLLLLVTNLVFAELYIVVDEKSKEIVTASEQNDTILQKGQELITLKGGFANYEFSDNPTNYFYKDNKFILNVKKINEQEKLKKELKEKDEEEKLIQERIRKISIDQLKIEGVIFKHLDK